MNDSQISVRYAKALFKSAQESDQADKIFADMEMMLDTCKVKEFKEMLEMPVISSEQKYKITIEVFKARISALTESLIKLVMDNRRENYLPGIARHYLALYKKHKGIKTASILTATTIDDSALKRLKEIVKKALKADVDLSSAVEESVIGGFILTVEDQQYDASVASGLKKMKKQLLETSVIK